MNATLAKALTVKSKYPSNASVSLVPLGENTSDPLEEAVPLETEEIEVPPILRSSDGMLVAFMEPKLLFDPGGEHTYDDEDWSTECGLPDTFDEGRYLDDVPLPEKMSSRSEENEDGVVSKSPKTAVRTKAVQLNLNESMNISKSIKYYPILLSMCMLLKVECK